MSKQLPPPGMTAHLQWNPNAEKPSTKKDLTYGIVDLVDYGKEISGNTLENALQNAMHYTREFNGGIISAPALIGAKSITTPAHRFWQKSYCVRSTEIYGVDTKGIYGKAGEPVLVIVHGGGVEPIQLVSFFASHNFAFLSQNEFDNLLEFNRLPTGKTIRMYTFNALTTGNQKIHDTYGIVLNDTQTRSTPELVCLSFTMFNSPLNIARTGASEHLENYYDRISALTNGVPIENPYANMSAPIMPQVRPLKLGQNEFIRAVRGPDYTYVVYEGRQ